MAEYNHTQAVSASTWTITHSLDVSEVAVDVMVDDGGELVKVFPTSVTHTDNDTLTVVFPSTQSGSARILG